MRGRIIKQINNLKITEDSGMYYVYDPSGKEIYMSTNPRDVRIKCESCTTYLNRKPKNDNSNMRLHLVTFCREPFNDDVDGGVEIAAVCDTPEKAQAGKKIVQEWLDSEGYTSGEVFIGHYNINHLSLYGKEIDL